MISKYLSNEFLNSTLNAVQGSQILQAFFSEEYTSRLNRKTKNFKLIKAVNQTNKATFKKLENDSNKILSNLKNMNSNSTSQGSQTAKSFKRFKLCLKNLVNFARHPDKLSTLNEKVRRLDSLIKQISLKMRFLDLNCGDLSEVRDFLESLKIPKYFPNLRERINRISQRSEKCVLLP